MDIDQSSKLRNFIRNFFFGTPKYILLSFGISFSCLMTRCLQPCCLTHYSFIIHRQTKQPKNKRTKETFQGLAKSSVDLVEEPLKNYLPYFFRQIVFWCSPVGVKNGLECGFRPLHLKLKSQRGSKTVSGH